MRIIQIYMFKELLKVFTVAVIFLTSLMFLDKLFHIAQLIFTKGVTAWEMTQIIAYISPGFLFLTIPIGVFLSSTIVFNQFSASSELDAMKACGWSFLDMLKPVFVFGFLAYLLSSAIVFYVLPWGNQSFKELIFHIVKTRANIEIKPKIFNTDFKDITLYVKDKVNDSTFKNIFISDNSTHGFNKVILSKKGSLVSDPENMIVKLQMQDGSIHDLSNEGKSYKLIHFDRYDITLAFPGLQDFNSGIFIGHRALSFGELREKIKSILEKGENADKQKVEMSKKFAIPFACILFSMAGAPMGVKSSRSGKSGGYAFSSLGILTYYILINTAQNMGNHGEIDPYLSVWIPNIILLALALSMIYKVQNEIPFKVLNSIADFFIDRYEFLRKLYTKFHQPKPLTPKRNPH